MNSFPQLMPYCTNLKHLKLSDNDISKPVPIDVDLLISLEILDLNRNKIPEVPETMARLTNLVSLQLEGNPIPLLPINIGNLKKLTTLNVRDANLMHFPSSLGNLPQLKSLLSSGNPFVFLFDSI